ncbi:hypothetical protein MKEN_01181200 [Mycena kentingensis (nom. inval.)]|nr:hypothetical protein MKEN_01181200 [Mycena kentingensis (nom. inval.)]
MAAIPLEDALRALRVVNEVVNPDDDFYTIAGAEETIGLADAKRKKELAELHANLKALSKIRDAARVSATRPASVPSAEAHATTMNDLEGTDLSLMKSIQEAEALVASREGELAALKEEARQLEDYDAAAEHEKELDGAALRLSIYKQLGFQPVLDKHGDLVKMLVTSQSGDIHIVEFSDRIPDQEHTATLWKRACS